MKASIRLVLATAILAVATGTSHAQDDPPSDQYVAAPIDADAKAAVAGINRFTLDLYKQTATPGQNIFLSPASVSTAVALAYRGALGPTADELRAVLHYTAPPERYLAAQAPILRAMNFTANGRTLRTNNALWLQVDLPMKPDYLADVSANAGAGLQRVDYRADPEAARKAINNWVEAATEKRIRNLLHQGEITAGTRVTLVNTIYWKGGWASRFDPASTKIGDFHRLGGGSVKTGLISQTATYRVLERDGIKAIDMPYGLGEVSMLALMPNDSGGLPKLEQLLTSEKLAGWMTALDESNPRKTVLTLPKMHLEWRDDLVPVLTTMGVRAAFDNNGQANFKAMATEPYPGEVPGAVGLTIAHIIHQTFLDVDEKGSEAAAATAVVMDVVVTGARVRAPEPPPFIFRADKPFLFLLRDRRTKMILFIGRYLGPTPKTAS